jgi:hypothetical protein
VTFSASATRTPPSGDPDVIRKAEQPKKTATGSQVSQAARLTDGATRARLRH